MNWKDILQVVEIIAMIVGGFAISYFRTSVVFRGLIAQLIADAERAFSEVEKAGNEKMAWVISKLYGYIPAVLKPLFPESKLREAVQTVFDKIKDFADLQVERLKTAYEKEKAAREETFRLSLEEAKSAANAGAGTGVATKAGKKTK